MAILTFMIDVITTVFRTYTNVERSFDMEFMQQFINGIVIALTVVVVATPEGLPKAVTITLAYSVGKMYSENNLVRKLHSSETMGGRVTEICTDMMGTTMNTIINLKAQTTLSPGVKEAV